MEWFVRGFMRAALAWLGVGVLLGAGMAFVPGAAVYRPVHTHANLLGFVAMMIFGVAYHVIPRFNGRPLHRRRWAEIHFWLAQVGLVLLVGGWAARLHLPTAGMVSVRAGAALSGAGALLFVVNLWVTLGARRTVAIGLPTSTAAR